MTKLFNNLFIVCDTPRPWGTYFQDTASPQMEALVELHDNIMFYLVIILFGVGWIIFSIVRNYVNDKSLISNKYLNHGTLIELIWTITPALILILIAFPSFKLLYLMDEVTDPSLTVFVEGHQWYWSYQCSDFVNDDLQGLEFDSYLVPESYLEKGVLFSESGVINGTDNSSLTFEQEQINRQSTCNHDAIFPLPLDTPNPLDDPIKCDLNPTKIGNEFVKHDAFRGGISPCVCNDCHLVMCHDCTNPSYDSE